MMISSPIQNHRKNTVTYSMTSLLDIVPTILDWFNISYMNQLSDVNELFSPQLTGKSLLPLLLKGVFTFQWNAYIIEYRYITLTNHTLK